jgi:hypothetical protein
MTQRIPLIIGIILLSGLAVWIWSSAPEEPMHEGKPLTVWLKRHVPTSAADPPYNSPGWKKADEALRKIGTNGIPVLLEMISATDSPLKLKFLDWIGKYKRLDRHYAYQKNEEAAYAFEMLGTNAASAVPALIRIYEERATSYTRDSAAKALRHIGPAARPAIPALLKDFSHADGEVRFDAVSAVAGIGGEPDIVIPALRGALGDPKPEVRWNASSGLVKYWRRASSAVPDLLAAIADPLTATNQALKQQFEYVIWQIAPEHVGIRTIVEESTPLIASGMTTQAVDFVYKGQRRKFITTGRQVPCLMQFFDSGPRSSISLYRTNAADGKDVFLGDFQVIGMSSSEDRVNVSLLCIVAEGKILLTARDNNSDSFLEVRRIK